MIRDKIENAEVYRGLSPCLDEVFSILTEGYLDAVESGRHELDGDQLYYLVQEYETKNPEDGKFEAHRQYVDVQVILEGSERMGYASLSELNAPGQYDAEKDVVLFGDPADTEVLQEYKAGEFAVFFPQDAHMPGIDPASGKSRVKKVIYKVRINSDDSIGCTAG